MKQKKDMPVGAEKLMRKMHRNKSVLEMNSRDDRGTAAPNA